MLATFWTALATATNPTTRTRSSVAAKGAAKTPLKAHARGLARIINAYPSITNQQRINLGLNPRSGQITPINPPENPPVLKVVSATGPLPKIKLRSVESRG